MERRDILITTNKGLEEVTIEEIRNILNENLETVSNAFGYHSKIIVKKVPKEKIPLLIYKAQTINDAIILIKEATLNKKSLNEIYDLVKSIEWSQYMSISDSFAVRSVRKGKHEYSSLDISSTVGKAIIDYFLEVKKQRPKVDLENPDITVRVYNIEDSLIIGIDLIGKSNLYKRGYRKYSIPHSIRPTLANQIVRFSGWNGDFSLLDPDMEDGTLVIEAAIYSLDIPGAFWMKEDLAITKLKYFNLDWIEFFESIDDSIEERKLEIYGIDKNLRNVRGAELNAIRAKVRKSINLLRMNLDWVDVKFHKESFDFIITKSKGAFARKMNKELEEYYEKLFYQADWILRPKGKFVILCRKPNLIENWINYYGYKIVDRRKVWQGGIDTFLYVLEK